MKKSIIIILISLASLGLLTTGCGKKDNEKTADDPIINTNEDVIKDQEVEGLSMKNTSLVTENGMSTFVTEVTNNTSSEFTLEEFKIYVKDADGNLLTTLTGYIGGSIQPGETRTIDSSTFTDISGAASIEYSIVK